MSGDASVEVSVPTDLTVTSDGESVEGRFSSRRQARELQALVADRAELQRIVEKQKLELQSKDAQIVALPAQHEAAAASALAQKDSDISSKQIQINRLEAELLRVKEELSTIRERAARELVQLTQKCSVFQQNQKRLAVRQEEIRASLANLQLSEEELIRLRSTPVQQLTLQQYTSLRVYELVWPLKLRIKELEAVSTSTESMLINKDVDLKSRSEQCIRLQNEVDELRYKCEQYSCQLVDIKDEYRADDFKVRNYNRVKSERDMFEEEKNTLTRKASELELSVATLKKEYSVLEERFKEVKVKSRRQESALNYNVNEVTDLSNKLEKVTEELGTCNKNLRFERDRYGELHEKYTAVRGDITSLTESYQDLQHEIKLLKEKNDSCSLQRTNLQEQVQQLSHKREELQIEVERYKGKYDAEVKDVEEQLKELKQNLNSANKSRSNLLDENTKLHQEFQALEIALHKEKLLRERESTSLRDELESCNKMLSQYQALEREFEKNIKTAAALPNGQLGAALERLLPSHALGGSKALEQSVHLTRRILKLERLNTEAASTIQQLTESLEQLGNKIAAYKTALGLAGQPSSKLLQRIADLDDQVTALQSALQFNSTSKTSLEEENTALIQEVTKLKEALQNFEIQNSELGAIKEQLITLRQYLPSVAAAKTLPSKSDADIPWVNLREDKTVPQPSAKAIIITKNVRKKLLPS
ncbi:hypothetical protein SK128_005864 [Halocaridina rubra]|uniref:Progesterone-induced-blocking factor 1 n=1 Tax=Halocaridina rubra TaxID=373956 RepID=A0AAN9A6E6_HALRR